MRNFRNDTILDKNSRIKFKFNGDTGVGEFKNSGSGKDGKYILTCLSSEDQPEWVGKHAGDYFDFDEKGQITIKKMKTVLGSNFTIVAIKDPVIPGIKIPIKIPGMQ